MTSVRLESVVEPAWPARAAAESGIDAVFGFLSTGRRAQRIAVGASVAAVVIDRAFRVRSGRAR